VATAYLAVPDSRYPDRDAYRRFDRALEERLRAQPEIESASLSSLLPTDSYHVTRNFWIGEPGTSQGAAYFEMVSLDYFATLKLPLLEGRTFPANIGADGPQVVIVNESLAHHFWPGESAVGKRIGGFDDANRPVWREVVGVVRDLEFVTDPKAPETPYQIYRPLVQEPWGYISVCVRGRTSTGLAEAMRRALAQVDPDIPLQEAFTVPESMARQLGNLRVVAQTLSAFALLGLALAALGVYGVVSDLVSQRADEFGVRIALGAQPRDVFLLVLGTGGKLALIGVASGIGGAYAIARFISSVLPRMAEVNFLVLGFLAVVLAAVTLFACWLPALRATKVDPLSALRAE
jgi:predicted permease